MKKIILKVEGMECEGCEKRIQNTIRMVDKVQEVVASHKDGTVSVMVEEGANESEIKEKIEDIGFKVKE